jgi:L-lactate dehydrogenase complex protein LldG
MSRETILNRLRDALDGDPRPPATVAPPDIRVPEAGEQPLLDLLAERLRDYRATVHRVHPDEIADAAATILRSEGVTRLAAPAGLPAGWLPPGIAVTHDHGDGPYALDGVEAAMTAAACAIAETGTVILDASPAQGRRVLTLLPDVHLCVIDGSQVTATVGQALARLDPSRPLTWISGPSATSDIELNRVEGVHGPRRLHVLIATRQPQPIPGPTLMADRTVVITGAASGIGAATAAHQHNA